MLSAFESADMSAHSKSYPRNPWLIDWRLRETPYNIRSIRPAVAGFVVR